ncbi:MAG: hypothetical protein ABSD42_03600 [Candidatus Bathyarchaeia archaeon]
MCWVNMFWERLFCSSDVELPKGFHYDPDVDMSGYIPLSKRMKASNVVPVSVAEEDAWRSYTAREQSLVKPEVVDGFDFYLGQAQAEIDSWKRFNRSPLFNIARYRNYENVGLGEKTNALCGQFHKYSICPNVDKHRQVGLDGVSHAGLVFVRQKHYHCYNPRCNICYKHGFAVREANKATQRIKSAEKTQGKAEHFIVGIPDSGYDLPYERLRAKVIKILRSRGVIGGALVFHGFRYANFQESQRKGVPFGWRRAPHFHCVGFLLENYDRCRDCAKATRRYVTGGGKTVSSIGNEKACAGCSGYESLTRKLNKGYVDAEGHSHPGDNYIVKVQDARKTIFGTFWYELTHATVRTDKSRFHVLTWFGSCSYRNLKVTIQKRKEVCPHCGEELKNGFYTVKSTC